ncbi:putative glycerophosphoryl diester phosphodiesterase [Actinacidiphila reveromycinica]|uniref:Putative glycerophosphoryl diester phosphodiesterase n=1 Tax=Actinacidiphila reveromycinica TaxID=659352 RepID=A0A7U3VR91_9ACTN|nr:glycerophosphodiester phosphodiesterase [Streptomyces sp. SN-593]BBB00499.1 putative glycerophosphoryl diester phosphodiesterase [Streptomyces sp. SN-593]
MAARPGHPVAVVAHRGDPYVHRENTLPSVRSALDRGADVVEVDVRLTRDGVPVLLHDPTLERLWGVAAPVASLAYQEVAEATGGGVPSFADALAELLRRPGPARMLIDLTEAAQAPAAVAAVREAGAADRVYYCGKLSAMREVRALEPAAEVAMTWTTSARPAGTLLDGLAPRWLNLRFGLADPATVAWAHDRGLLVAAWTADRRRSMARLVAAGVDAITTNRPEVLLRLRGRTG